MKAIRETRLIGAFLLMIVLGVLLKSHFSVPASMFNKAIGVLKQWIQQFQPQPEENITWGQK
ncbi:TPA: hypothetical protein IUX83_001920 [Enterococcus faecalis]|nr:hypothetical protein [Enterococcus faecalis]